MILICWRFFFCIFVIILHIFGDAYNDNISLFVSCAPRQQHDLLPSLNCFLGKQDKSPMGKLKLIFLKLVSVAANPIWPVLKGPITSYIVIARGSLKRKRSWEKLNFFSGFKVYVYKLNRVAPLITDPPRANSTTKKIHSCEFKTNKLFLKSTKTLHSITLWANTKLDN